MAKTGLFTFFLLFVGLGVLFVGLNQGGAVVLDAESVTNESITVNYSDTVQVSQTGWGYEYNDSVTVYNSSGVELVDGTDYEWYQDNGSVAWFDTPDTTDGETATISYTYEKPPESSKAMATTVSALGGVLGMLLFAVIGSWLFDIVGGF